MLKIQNILLSSRVHVVGRPWTALRKWLEEVGSDFFLSQRRSKTLNTSNVTLTVLDSVTALLETQHFSSTALVSGSGNVKGKLLLVQNLLV